MTEHNWKHDTMIDVEAMVKKGVHSAPLTDNL